MRYIFLTGVLAGLLLAPPTWADDAQQTKDAVDAINQEYGESPQQGMIQEQGSRYLKTKFPKLTYVKTTSISTSLLSEEGSPASGKDEDDL